MAGVRIQHPTQKNVRFNIIESDIPYKPGPRQCSPPEFGGCGQIHVFKTHHLTLDETGSVIVEQKLYAKIKQHCLAAGFVQANIVKKPPAMGIGLAPQVPGTGAFGNIPIITPEGN